MGDCDVTSVQSNPVLQLEKHGTMLRTAPQSNGPSDDVVEGRGGEGRGGGG